jgi:SRSO17 transposase
MAVLSTQETRVRRYFDHVIGAELQQTRQRKSFAAYALGILGEGERKSCEPIAARSASGKDEQTTLKAVDQAHNRLLHFLAYSPWNDEAVRLAAAQYAIEEIEKFEPVTTWVIDDTGFPKQGRHSVGVHRQYSGTLGKVGNCQIGVSLSIATSGEHLPVDFELYLPTAWTEDPARRVAAHIPAGVVFKTKIEQAIDMIERAKKHGIPGDIVLADAAYGTSARFRQAIREAGMDYGVAIQANTKVFMLDSRGRRRGDAILPSKLAEGLGRSAFRRLTWRDGTKARMSAMFCFRRVKVRSEDDSTSQGREEVWLVMEWPEGDAAKPKFILTTLRRRMSKKEIVRILKERWRTEQAYAEMKGELGLDHFEGRSYRGWHHHVSVVISCYAFVVAERRRLSPPRVGRPQLVRTAARRERHFADSFASIRQAIARVMLRWLDRCPTCLTPTARADLNDRSCACRGKCLQ